MNALQLQYLSEEQWIEDQERERIVKGILSTELLKNQNTVFDGTMGVSRNNREAGFVPAYFDRASGLAVVSRFADGRPAPVHVLDGLPEEWITQKDATGRVTKVRAGVIAGFLRDGCFYTREEAVFAASH